VSSQVTADLWIPTLVPVIKLHSESDEVITLTLDTCSTPWDFQPGQFNMLYSFGRGESAISISGDPATPQELVHTIRRVGSVTNALGRLRVGDFLGVRGPFGKAWPLDQADGADVVVVAGGIGLAPLRPLIYQLLRHRERYNRVVLLYGARSPKDMLYIDQLRTWRGRFDTQVLVTVDAAEDSWRGPVGAVTRLVHNALFDPDDTVVFTCGPEIMMHFVVHECIKEGVPTNKIWLSMERNMQCGVGLCGHCQWGPHLVCRHGPVFRYDQVAELFSQAER